jgi:GNAT superfamily N-acetyltransferase
MKPQWRPATKPDLDAIQRIADRIHPELPERPEIFAEKLALFAEGCFVLAGEAAIAGYAFAHPWHLKQIPPLDTLLHALPPAPECLFVHDVAVLPEARGHGAAAMLVAILTRVAKKHDLPRLALVSVYGSDVLWAAQGFKPAKDKALQAALTPYGESAKYMMRKL